MSTSWPCEMKPAHRPKSGKRPRRTTPGFARTWPVACLLLAYSCEAARKFGTTLDEHGVRSIKAPTSSNIPRIAQDDLLLRAGLDPQDLQSFGLDINATIFQENDITVDRTRPALSDSELPPFDLDKATRMARLTSIAYCSDPIVISDWTCTRCQRVTQFTAQEVVFDQIWNLMGYVGYDSQQDAIVLSFRGTDSKSWGNWINNLKTWRQNKLYPIPEAPRALVHSGFYDLWTKSALQVNMTRIVGELLQRHKTPRLFVSGHSMGAALASLAALDMKFKYNFTEIRSWTFGSPRVGNLVWAQFYADHVAESWRFTHNRDVVPSLPPQMIGFHHVAREAWTVDYSGSGGIIEQKILICDDSGEDPSCHNSACRLGMCTSVADHLLYLGVEMYRDPLEC